MIGEEEKMMALLQTRRRGESDQDDNRAFVMFLRVARRVASVPIGAASRQSLYNG